MVEILSPSKFCLVVGSRCGQGYSLHHFEVEEEEFVDDDGG